MGTMANAVPWTLTIPSDLCLLPLARSFIEAVCTIAGFDERLTHAVVLATDEAVNNVMRHAHRDQPDAPIQLHCYFHSDGIEILVHDQGDPFDLDAVPHLNPAELRIGGRGVYLMRRLMDELSCRPRGSRGNVLRMVKRGPGTSSSCLKE
jgi:serine/threonine-protein kinase RsbW